MNDRSKKKQDVEGIEAEVMAGLDESLFGDLGDVLETDEKKVIPAPAKPKPRPAKPKDYETIWRETATENINAAADTLAAISDAERRQWLAFLVEALEKRLGPESLGHMQTVIKEHRRKGKG